MKHLLPVISLLIFLISCNEDGAVIEAYGHFEADEVLISSEASGQLIAFALEKGHEIDSGQLIAQVDTQSFHLQKLGFEAQIASINAKALIIMAQKRVADIEIEGLNKEVIRIKSLVESGAGKEQDLDRLISQRNVALEGLKTFDAQIVGVKREVQFLNTQTAVLNQKMSRASIVAPLDGTVLETFARRGELVGPNKPLSKIADLSKMDLRAYVSGFSLSSLKIGQTVNVRIDNQSDGYYSYSGKIIWVADQAEFTPKIIQTKEERLNLVYAVLVRVVNDGRIKIGMPGEMVL